MTQSTPRLPQQIVAWRSPRDPAGAERGKTADWPRLRERVAALYRQIPIQVLAGLLSLVILLVQLSGRMATMPLLGWAGLVLLCLAFRWGVGRVERRAALKLGMREWERLWFMAALPGAVALAAAIGHSLAQVPAENRLMLLGSVIPAAAGGLVLVERAAQPGDHALDVDVVLHRDAQARQRSRTARQRRIEDLGERVDRGVGRRERPGHAPTSASTSSSMGA